MNAYLNGWNWFYLGGTLLPHYSEAFVNGFQDAAFWDQWERA